MLHWKNEMRKVILGLEFCSSSAPTFSKKVSENGKNNQKASAKYQKMKPQEELAANSCPSNWITFIVQYI